MLRHYLKNFDANSFNHHNVNAVDDISIPISKMRKLGLSTTRQPQFNQVRSGRASLWAQPRGLQTPTRHSQAQASQVQFG